MTKLLSTIMALTAVGVAMKAISETKKIKTDLLEAQARFDFNLFEVYRRTSQK
nr:MAG TPA: hypothetical protein [Bacteriophage sp.]